MPWIGFSTQRTRRTQSAQRTQSSLLLRWKPWGVACLNPYVQSAVKRIGSQRLLVPGQDVLDAAGAGHTVIPMPTLTFKTSAADERAIRIAARRKNLSLSAYLRHVALQGAPVQKPRLVRSLKTGASVVVSAAGTPKLTSARVRALLTDFP